MRTRPLAVLKIGGSLLSSDACLDSAVEEIHRWLGDGYQPLVVVSAYGALTDQLSRRALAISPLPDSGAYASFLSSGEALSVAALGLATRRQGLHSEMIPVSELGLETSGDHLEAEPRKLRPKALRRALENYDVVLVPGFVGAALDGSATLLGRGGSDMTAIFLAARLRAERCVLLKDVDGWFVEDPRQRDAGVPRYQTLHWRDAISVPCPIVQSRAVELSARLDMPFEVAAYDSKGGTRVGREETRIAASVSSGRSEKICEDPLPPFSLASWRSDPGKLGQSGEPGGPRS
ncbi:MAG: hypothetical protein K0U98_22080 [Deltaproteobacteria bacterium]|nr:hypothetical protein [Deltaproteobacteria bacterium]